MPAAAVIPAPIAYIKVVAVKKLVVGFWHLASPVCPRRVCTGWPVLLSGSVICLLFVRCNSRADSRQRLQIFYFEKIRVFKAGLRCEYISME